MSVVQLAVAVILLSPGAAPLHEVARLMGDVEKRLEAGSAGDQTQRLQAAVLERLSETIADLEKKPAPTPKDKDRLAELKLVYALQKRITTRTAMYADLCRGDRVPAPEEVTGADLREQVRNARRELKALAVRQAKIAEVVRGLAPGS